MSIEEIIDGLIVEIEYRSKEGIVNFKNPNHISILSELLVEWDMIEIKDELLANLMEAGTTPRTSKEVEKDEKEDDGYESTGGTGYVKSGDFRKWQANPDDTSVQRYIKTKAGKYEPITKPEPEDTSDDKKDVVDTSDKESDETDGSDELDVERRKNAQETLGTEDYQKHVDAITKAGNDEVDDSGEMDDLRGKSNEELLEIDRSTVYNQLTLTKSEAEKQARSKSKLSVGLGTADSRSGESAVVYAGTQLKKLLEGGESYKAALNSVSFELNKMAAIENAVLTPEWVTAAVSTIDHINDTIGIENVKHFAWDTKAGNQLVGSIDHGTSADMFVQTNDGSTIGISLKKELKVFIVNDGYDKAMKIFEEMIGNTLPENCQSTHYKQLRETEFKNAAKVVEGDQRLFLSEARKMLKDEEYFDKVFTKKSADTAKRYIQEKLGIKDYRKAKAKQLINILQNPTNTSMRFSAGFYKSPRINEKYGIYSKLRGLDDVMTSNITGYLNGNPVALDNYKSTIIESTHIMDTLFPNSPLSDFKTIFGEKPAVEMTRDSITKIFGIDELMKLYNSEDGDKESIMEKIQDHIKNKLSITKKNGVPVIALKLTDPESELPLYRIGVRARGIGSAQTMEISQETFGSLSLKNGSADMSTWDTADVKRVVSDEASGMFKELSDDTFDFDDLRNDLLKSTELTERITQLKKWDSKSNKISAIIKLLKKEKISI